jgi:hypothetical protein
MLFSVLTAVLLAQAPKPVVPFTDVTVRDGRVVAGGREFVAVADRISISPDGKRVILWGKDTPAEFVGRPQGQQEFVVAGQRITIDLGAGTLSVVCGGPGQIRMQEK